jgi:adenosylhomocysteine nucleosidase
MRTPTVQRRLGIVTGLMGEALTARSAAARKGIDKTYAIVRCGGPGLEAAGRAAESAIADGADILVSFGLAGALKPGLDPGALILPRRVISAEGPPLKTDADSADAIAFAVASAVRVWREDLVSVGIVIGGLAEKAALGEASNAVSVDMESYGVARAAAKAGKPFLVLRAIADPADRIIPPAAQQGMGKDGRVKPLTVLAALARDPQSIGPVLRLGQDTRVAMRALGRAARLAFPVLLVGR